VLAFPSPTVISTTRHFSAVSTLRAASISSPGASTLRAGLIYRAIPAFALRSIRYCVPWQLRSADGTIVDMVHVAGSRLMQSDGSEILLFLNTRLNYHLYYFNSIASLAPAEHQLAQFPSASVFLAMCTCPSCAVLEYASTQTAR
jgi:hypothetical protein